MAVRRFPRFLAVSAAPSTPSGGTALSLAVPAATALTGALCQGMDPEVFFPDPDDAEGAAVAKAVCARCPVAAACLDLALERREPLGIYGGLTPVERDALAGRANGCGSVAGYARHRRWGERPCRACNAANNAAALAGKRARRSDAA